MKPYSKKHPEEEQRPLPHADNDKEYAPAQIDIVIDGDDSRSLIPLPKYHKIFAEYIPAPSFNQYAYFQYVQFCPEFEPNNPVVLHGIVKGEPATTNDQSSIRQHQINQANAHNRRLQWTYIRKLQGFICLNICYLVVLLISINSNFSDYRKYENRCPNYSKTNLFFAIVGAAWILVSISGIYAAMKKQERFLHYYTAGLYGILILTVVITAFGLLVGDSSPECTTSISKTVPIIGTALFTLFVVGLFAYIATKLRRMLIALAISQPSQQQGNPVQQIIQMRSAQPGNQPQQRL